MKLRTLLQYEQIVIQCHDNPDADALASGYGIYQYLKRNGKTNVRLVYGGPYAIQKSNLKLMVEELDIPIDYIRKLTPPELLILVDCQYGQGNVQRFEAENVVVIDHHQVSTELPELHEVRSQMGACSTIVWDLLEQEGIQVNEDQNLATACYYGLMTDTNNFTELSQDLDRRIRDDAKIDKELITRFRNANLSLEELSIAGEALINYDYSEKYRLALVGAKPCDPNILGLISDLVLEVDVVDQVLVYSVLPFGIKYSVRSCISEIHANRLAEALCEGIGSGGGHFIKAGGFIQRELFEPAFARFVERNHGVMESVRNADGTYQLDWVNQFLKERVECFIREENEKLLENKTAVIFDLDGTLLDTLEDLYRAVNAALVANGMPERTIDEVRQFVGNGVKKLMERAIPEGLENPGFEETYAYFRQYYSEHCKEHTAPYEGIMELLQKLKAKGIRTAIVSNKMDPAVKILHRELFADVIDVALGESENVRKKPARDMVDEALKELGVDRKQAIYVGDSDVDIATAKNSDLPCISVTWGFRDSYFLLQHGARCLVDQPSDILGLLGLS